MCQQILLFSLLNIDWNSPEEVEIMGRRNCPCIAGLQKADVTCWGCLPWCPWITWMHEFTQKAWLQYAASVQGLHFTWLPLLALLLQLYPWSPQQLLFPKKNSLSLPENMKIFETEGEVAETEAEIFSQNIQMAIYRQQLFWREKKAVIWIPLDPGCVPYCLYSSNTGCSSMGEGFMKVRSGEDSGN